MMKLNKKSRKFLLGEVGVPKRLLFALLFYKLFPNSKRGEFYRMVLASFLYKYYKRVGEREFDLRISMVTHPAGKRI